MSKDGVDRTVLLSGGTSKDIGRVYESTEILIAIGTQAGKVFVFNVLGLCIHEIAMDVPVTAVEWIGSMSAPSVLPNQILSLSPEPVVDATGSSSVDESGTVKVSPHKRAGKSAILLGQKQDLFSDGHPERLSRPTSHISSGSPLQIERRRERPRRKSMVRPRIATETFISLPGPVTSGPVIANMTKLPELSVSRLTEARRSPQVPQPQMRPALQIRIASGSRASSRSSQDSEFSDQEWFTPPSTRREQKNAPERLLSQVSSIPTATRVIPRCSIRNVPPANLDLSNSVDLHPNTQMVNGLNGNRRSGTAQSSKTFQRQGTIDEPGSSEIAVSSSLYDRQKASNIKDIVAQDRRSSNSTKCISNAVQKSYKCVGTPPTPESPSSDYSRSISGAMKDPIEKARNELGVDSLVSIAEAQYHRRSKPADSTKRALFLDAPSRIYSRPKLELFGGLPRVISNRTNLSNGLE